jgi:hypothetical protein
MHPLSFGRQHILPKRPLLTTISRKILRDLAPLVLEVNTNLLPILQRNGRNTRERNAIGNEFSFGPVTAMVITRHPQLVILRDGEHAVTVLWETTRCDAGAWGVNGVGLEDAAFDPSIPILPQPFDKVRAGGLVVNPHIPRQCLDQRVGINATTSYRCANVC